MASSVLTADDVIANLRWIAATIILAWVIQLTISFVKKYRKNQEIWESVKDIPEASTVMEGKPFSLMGVTMEEVKCGSLSRHTQPDGYLINALEPESVKVLMDGVDKKTNYNWKLFRPFLGDGLVASDGAKWFRNRKMLTPAFHFNVLKDYVHIFQESVEYYLEEWSKRAKSGTSVEVTKDIDTMLIKSLIKCAFGDFPLPESKRVEWHQHIKDIMECYMLRYNKYLLSYDFIYFLTTNGRKCKNAITKSRELSRQVVREKRAKQLDEDGNPLSEKELLDEVQTFFFAGHDTTASAMPYVLYNLAKHPEYQEKCREEIENVIQGRTNFEWNDLAKLEFLNMCIKESLRLHPPIWTVNRQCVKPKVFPDGRVLPVDSQVGTSIYAVLHNPKFWENPDVFDPYRFSREKSSTMHPYAYVPFSAGTRNCIGKNFALTELRVCVASTLRRFQLSLDPEKPLEMHLRILLKTKDGLWLKMDEIQPQS